MNKLTNTKIILFLIIVNFITISLTAINILFLILSIPTFSLLLLAFSDIIQTKHSLLRSFPVIGRLRWIFESERSKIQQYFVENDKNGTPYNRERRSDVYQKSKNQQNTTPFGTQLNVYKKNHNYIEHSMWPVDIERVKDLKITFGNHLTKNKFETSIFNISAMSYGALSKNAIKALNIGAKMGNFYHNTGEGGISKYHLNGGNLVFQIGTGYFGCGKTENNKRIFDENIFSINSRIEAVKMIEIKLSQGAKPGHGGILPKKKNTEEIAKIRNVEKNTEVISPAYHSAFRNNEQLIKFIEKVRKLSGNKPVGIKMCLGNKEEVESLFSLFKELNSYPDFITIDGSEGGTGAAPYVFTNNVGTPLKSAVKFIRNLIDSHGLDMKLIVSGKISNSYDIIKYLKMGADSINAARAFMLSMGCIQARECNKDTCPVGISTQDKNLVWALDPKIKSNRVYSYHKNLMHEVKEVLAAMGIEDYKNL